MLFSSFFLLVIFCWSYCPHLRVVCFPRETPLEQLNFHFLRDYQLENASGLGMGHVFFYILLSALGIHLVQTLEGPMQAVSFSVNFYISQSCYVSNALFHCCLTSPLALLLFLSPFSQFSPLNPDLRELREILGQSSVFQGLSFSQFSACGSLYLCPYPSGRNHSDDD